MDGRVEGEVAETAEPSVGTAILGGGPAGLTAAYLLGRNGAAGVVFEADGAVGGIAKTVVYDGYRFDLGGHRFFTKLPQVQRLWEDVLGDELLLRPRLSRIYYDGKFFAYPLQAKDVIARLGVAEAVLCTLSYFRSRLAGRRRPQETFEDWVEARFGRRLYDAFFGPYTEKVWGVPGSQIRAEWAAQRIQNFSFVKAVLSILGVRSQPVTTLAEEFHYPRLGPGQMWEEFQRLAESGGIPVRLRHRVEAVRHQAGHVTEIVVSCEGRAEIVTVDAVLSSIPLSDLVLSLDPAPPAEVAVAARRLRYRELCLVALVIADDEPFPDNWIYLHDPGTRAGRVQNFGAWSSDMVKPGTTCLGVEYFCFEGDEIWELPDADAVELATDELTRIGLIDRSKVIDGVKVRVPRAYPMYDGDYHDAVLILKGYLAGFDNLKTFGRNGLHRYNNQDHSMWTAVLATDNLLTGADHDVWSVNVEESYLEEGEALGAMVDLDIAG
jgi:protoporphyrinogen oxidase